MQRVSELHMLVECKHTQGKADSDKRLGKARSSVDGIGHLYL